MVAALSVLSVVGCGRKLPPLPPVLDVPARIEPLQLSQEGADVVLRFPYPTRTATGEELSGLSEVTVWREILSAPGGANPQAPKPLTNPEERAREERTFRQNAVKVASLSRNELDESTLGTDIVYRDSLVPLYRERGIGRVFLRYAVTASRGRKDASPLSPLAALLPRVPPEAPDVVFATVEENQVCLEWPKPAGMLDGSKPARIAAYAVFRRLESDDAYESTPLGTESRGEFYIDRTAAPEKRYRYTVRAVPALADAFILGPPSLEVKVDTKDVFAPPPPGGLLVLSEEAGTRLVWNPVPARDLAGYRIYRRATEGGAFEKIAEVKEELSYLDKITLVPGAKTRWAVTAFDARGNESARSEASGDAR